VVELADIFRRYGPAYREKYGQRMPPSHRKAMWAIEHCRTEALGGHVFHCDGCDETRYSYHSCRNRHCPKCQNDAGQQWLSRQQDLLLSVPYFMLTFTLPFGLRQVARRHQKCIYNLLFRTSAAAMQKLALDPRFVGGQIGMVGVLHTWARDLSYHPHVHYLVPAGGLSHDGQHWQPANENFLVPVKALSAIFRAKFRDALRQTDLFDLVPPEVWQKDWVVHCKPVGNGSSALKYLAPYIFRVAISNNRIVKLENDKVTFRYQDAKTGKKKYCVFPAEKFIQRFLQHVLPQGFMKVRYYGFLSAGNRKRLNRVRESLGTSEPAQTTDDQQLETMMADTLPCPKCGQAMQMVQTLRVRSRCPP
jgi:hypothetical protein